MSRDPRNEMSAFKFSALGKLFEKSTTSTTRIWTYLINKNNQFAPRFEYEEELNIG